jgi:hypothetical protein
LGERRVDGLTFTAHRYGGIPFIQMSDNDPTGEAELHFRNVSVHDPEGKNRRPLVDRGGGSRVAPQTATSVPVYLHDHYGPGRHAKIMSTAAKDFSPQRDQYSELAGVTGPDSRAKEVRDVDFPQLLDPVDDLPPATVITWPAPGHVARLANGALVVRGFTTDNESTRRVVVNGVAAESTDFNFHQWQARLPGIKPGKLKITAHAEDEAGNVEAMGHAIEVVVE